MTHRRKLPKYRQHKPSGQAVVTLTGRDFYLGPYDSAVSRVEYDRLVAEWLVNGRALPPDPDEGRGLTVSEVMQRYWEFSDDYYRQGEKPAPEWYHIRTALKVVRRLYGTTQAAEFGPLALKACRQQFLNRDQNRRTINQNVGRVKRMFRWAVENELVPPGLYHGLQAVAGLRGAEPRRGRARASSPSPRPTWRRCCRWSRDRSRRWSVSNCSPACARARP